MSSFMTVPVTFNIWVPFFMVRALRGLAGMAFFIGALLDSTAKRACRATPAPATPAPPAHEPMPEPARPARPASEPARSFAPVPSLLLWCLVRAFQDRGEGAAAPPTPSPCPHPPEPPPV